MRAKPSKRLIVLSEAEKLALYGLPDFDDFQREENFTLTDAERSIVHQRNGLPEQIYCLLQIGYFKAKHAFFNFSWQDVPLEDVAFVLQRYFPGKSLIPIPLRKNEYYAQRHAIARLFGFHLWSEDHRPMLAAYSTPFGHLFHGHPATQSTAIRPGGRSEATLGSYS